MNPWRGLNKIPKSIWHISAATVINRCGMMVLPFLALYLTQKMGYNAAEAGLVITVYGLGSLLFAPVSGKLSDKFGSVTVMKYSLLLAGCAFFVYPFLDSYYLIIAYTVPLAVIVEAFRPASMAFISERVKPSQSKSAFALYRLAINFGMSIGPVIGGLLTEINFDILFYADGGTSILAALYLFSVKLENYKPALQTEAEQTPVNKIPAYKNRSFIYFLAAMVPVTIVFFQHLGVMPLFIVDELGYSKPVYGMISAVNTILVILIEVPLNNSMSGWADWKALFLGSLLSGIGFGLFAFVDTVPGILAAIVVWTFGEMIFFPAGSALAAAIAPEGKKGEYMGFFQMMFGVSFTAAPILGMFVLQSFGSFWVWIGTFFFGITSAFMMIRLKKIHAAA